VSEKIDCVDHDWKNEMQQIARIKSRIIRNHFPEIQIKQGKNSQQQNLERTI
jgi:hypothetical protein